MVLMYTFDHFIGFHAGAKPGRNDIIKSIGIADIVLTLYKSTTVWRSNLLHLPSSVNQPVLQWDRWSVVQ